VRFSPQCSYGDADPARMAEAAGTGPVTMTGAGEVTTSDRSAPVRPQGIHLAAGA